MPEYVNWLRHASPYINAHRDCTFVVMLPGDEAPLAERSAALGQWCQGFLGGFGLVAQDQALGQHDFKPIRRQPRQGARQAKPVVQDGGKAVPPPLRQGKPSRRAVGMPGRVPDHRALQALLALHNAPLLATTLILPDETAPLNDAEDIRERLQHELAGVIDAGACALEPTTVIDLTPMGTGGDPEVLRQGQGELARLGL